MEKPPELPPRPELPEELDRIRRVALALAVIGLGVAIVCVLILLSWR